MFFIKNHAAYSTIQWREKIEKMDGIQTTFNFN